MKESILMSLDTINDVVCESEVAAAEALLAEYDKALAILEYSETEPEQFGIFQEGKIMDDVKKQGEGQSKVMRILSFIPRLIAALFKAITGKLQTAAKSAKNVVENTKGKDQSKIKTFIEGLKKGDKKAVKTALIALGATAGVVGGVGAGIAIKKKFSGDSDSFDMLKPCLSDEDFKELKRLIDLNTDAPDTDAKKEDAKEDAKKAISILEKVDYSKLKQSEEKEKDLREKVNSSIKALKEYISDEKASTSNAEKKETSKTDEEPSTDEKKETKSTKNEPESSIKFPVKMDKAIDDIMKQYSDLQNSGIVKLIDFIYDPKTGLQVAYNGSVYGLCGVIGGIGYDIMNHPDKLDKFKSFYNSYSDTVKKLASARCKTMTAAIAACATNNIESNSIKKDQLWPIYNTEDISKNVREFNDDTIEQFSSYFKGMKNDDDLKNNTEAIKALETIADIIKHVNSDILAYMSAIVNIITKLEDIFGYEKMWSHTDEKAWKSVREVHKS